MLWIQEDAVQVDERGTDNEKRYRLGHSEPYETDFEDTGKLYKRLQAEYGRCVSKVYIDGKDGKPQHIGWCFEKREAYEDAPSKSYILETWVSVHDGPPSRTTTYQYHTL